MSTIPVEQLARVAVVGTSGCGKTRFASRLAQILDAPHIELDAIYWGPNWTPVPAEQFRSSVADATTECRWICDGNYHPVRDLVWGRATAIAWLNYSFPVVFGLALRRSLVRSIDGQPLFSGNRESLALTFFSRESILLWVLRTYWRRRRDVPRLLADPRFAHLQRLNFLAPKQAERWLDEIAADVDKSILAMSSVAENPCGLVN